MTNAVPTIEVVILSALAVLFAVASLLSKDNFYSAFYMCLTMLMIAGIYAYYGVHSAFALISLIFIGALGVITLIFAYSYREQKSIEFKLRWVVFALIVAVFMSLTLPITTVIAKDYVGSLFDFEPIYMLFALSMLLMLTLIEVWREKS
jgi:NADH:ubiquinone oxidoreductase subunit 6 (subunit J)